MSDFDVGIVTRNALDIVKVANFILFVGAVTAIVSRRSASLVAVVYLVQQAVRLNFAGIGLGLKGSEAEEIARVICLFFALIGFAFCHPSAGRSRERKHTQTESQGSIGKTEEVQEARTSRAPVSEKKRRH